jgi:hypothetical protein
MTRRFATKLMQLAVALPEWAWIGVGGQSEVFGPECQRPMVSEHNNAMTVTPINPVAPQPAQASDGRA